MDAWLHFQQLFQSIKYFEFPNKEYIHVEFGTVNDEEGNPFRTRDGDTKLLSELYDETYNYIKKINKDLISLILINSPTYLAKLVFMFSTRK